MWMSGAVLLVVGMGAPAIEAQSSSTKGEQGSSITVTGCLQSEPSAVGTSGSTAAASADRSRSATSGPFRLINARVGGAPGGGSGVTSVAPPGSGTTEAAVQAGATASSPVISGAITKNGEPDKSATQVYRLRGSESELPHHVGQEVEISGYLAAPTTAGSSSSPGATTTPGARVNSTAGGNAAANQELEVRTIRMIASVCAAR